jgi:DNA-binding NarL/FixJ family response regulator
MSGLSVLVADDHELFRSGLIGLLEERGVRAVGEAANGTDAIRLTSELRPDVVLMDLCMPGMSGIEATRRVASSAPLVPVLVLTVSADDEQVIEALLAGATGYLLKESTIHQIVDGIEAAARGESAISPRIARGLVRRLQKPLDCAPAPRVAELTPRELEVLRLLACGMDNAAIAQMLYVSQHTVKSHVSNILRKLQVENRVQAAVRAERERLV